MPAHDIHVNSDLQCRYTYHACILYTYLGSLVKKNTISHTHIQVNTYVIKTVLCVYFVCNVICSGFHHQRIISVCSLP